MSRHIENRLCDERAARGFSQSRMAELGGISRQGYAAIESGASVPSTEVALRLARGLGTSIESLFRLPDEPRDTVEVEAAVGLELRLGPMRIARIGGRTIGFPLHRGVGGWNQRADGSAVRIAEDRVHVSLFGERPREVDLVAVGCDPSFAIVADSLRGTTAVETLDVQLGSRAALEALAMGHAHIAGVHLLDPESGDYNERWIRELIPFPCVRVRYSLWEQALFVRPGNPLGIRSPADLARPGLRYLNREPGSGTRMLLDLRLAAQGIDPKTVSGYGSASASGHLAVAEAVASGLVDAGMGIRAAGLARGLDVVPVAREAYDLVVPRHFLDLPAVTALLDGLRAPALRAQIDALGGYDVEGMGDDLGMVEPRAVTGKAKS